MIGTFGRNSSSDEACTQGKPFLDVFGTFEQVTDACQNLQIPIV